MYVYVCVCVRVCVTPWRVFSMVYTAITLTASVTATYSNWKTGQPNNVAGDQDCLLLQYPDLDFQWGDVDCDERHPFICKTQHPTPMATGAQSGSSPLIG